MDESPREDRALSRLMVHWRTTVRSFRGRNFRLFMLGHGISNTGMWIQQTAELWAILELTNSGIALGLHSVLKFGPVLVFGAYGGLLSDRINRRKLMLITQVILLIATSLIAVAAVAGFLTLPLIYAVVFVQGMVNAVDNPLRRGFVHDLSTDEELTNALSLSSGVATMTRILGPAIAGVLIAGLGIAWCFVINAVSFVAVLISLLMINVSELRPSEPVPREKAQLREGFRYAMSNRRVRVTLAMVTILSVFAWNWHAILPIYTTDVLDGDAGLFGFLVSTMSLGSFVGAIVSARMEKVAGRHLVWAGFAISGAMLTLALAPGIAASIAGLLLLGAAGTTFVVASQARIQLNSGKEMIGRMMSLFTIGWQGSRPLGAMLAGVIIDVRGPRYAFGLGFVVVALTSLATAFRGPGREVRAPGQPIFRRSQPRSGPGERT